ncbi:MAG: Uma2 family endonuclease, partial [Thermoleophilaceae bacterium]
MSAVPVAERMTAEEFLALPAPVRSQRRQLVDGEVVVNEPRPLHQRVLMDLAFALESWTREDPSRGEVTLPLDVRLDDRNVYAPDVLFYAGDRGPGRS